MALMSVSKALLQQSPPDTDNVQLAPSARRDDQADARILASLFSPKVAVWLPIVHRLGLSLLDVMRLEATADANSTDFQSELLASNLVGEQDLFREIAREFQIDFIEQIDPHKLTISDDQCSELLRSQGKYLRASVFGKDGRARSIFVPRGLPLADLRRVMERNKDFRRIICMTSPQELRRAALAKVQKRLALEARNGLFERYPILSARHVISAWQGVFLGAGLVIMSLAFVFAASATLMAAHVFFSVFFLGCVALRFAAVRSTSAPVPVDLEATPMGSLPFYSVLVALHHEAEVVPQLIEALVKLRWPCSKLEIKLVCEADDRETLSAIAQVKLPHHFEVVEVPPGQPRTKPKALNYALQLIRGDYVVLYDAEDRPHPLQLLEAWRRFQSDDEWLACVQAPLQISNGARGIIPLMFAFEYSALFRGLLPWLSGHRALLPLGGTSNHFRKSALEEIGGWDPYNVTEDADIGLRLARFGYRTGTISLPTWEDAPEELSIWLPQRTRWFKGWLQSWLVHMRSPKALLHDVGVWSFCLAQILFAGLVISALIHPLLIFATVALIFQIFAAEPATGWKVMLLSVDCINVFCGYFSFLLLGMYSRRRRDRRSFWRIVLFTPAYWLMMSAAAWRAVLHLWRHPHHWEKTPHFRSRGSGHRTRSVNPE